MHNLCEPLWQNAGATCQLCRHPLSFTQTIRGTRVHSVCVEVCDWMAAQLEENNTVTTWQKTPPYTYYWEYMTTTLWRSQNPAVISLLADYWYLRTEMELLQ